MAADEDEAQAGCRARTSRRSRRAPRSAPDTARTVAAPGRGARRSRETSDSEIGVPPASRPSTTTLALSWRQRRGRPPKAVKAWRWQRRKVCTSARRTQLSQQHGAIGEAVREVRIDVCGERRELRRRWRSALCHRHARPSQVLSYRVARQPKPTADLADRQRLPVQLVDLFHLVPSQHPGPSAQEETGSAGGWVKSRPARGGSVYGRP